MDLLLFQSYKLSSYICDEFILILNFAATSKAAHRCPSSTLESCDAHQRPSNFLNNICHLLKLKRVVKSCCNFCLQFYNRSSLGSKDYWRLGGKSSVQIPIVCSHLKTKMDGTQTWCTGTILSDVWVATSTRCVDEYDGKIVPPKEYHHYCWDP